MATGKRTTGTRDEHYDIVSTLYHALQGAETCATYLQDAEQAGDQDLAEFFRGGQDLYRQLADRGKTLLWQRLRPLAAAPGVLPGEGTTDPPPDQPPPPNP